ncbi:hypothetical protein ACFLRZ_00905 [Bacteroidota bacterium]
MAYKRKSRARKRKYKKITFKLSSRQYRITEKYCKIYNITPNKLFKILLRNHLDHFPNLDKDDTYTSKNQLKLFDSKNVVQTEIEFQNETEEMLGK